MRTGVVFPQTEIGEDPVLCRDFAQTAEGLGYTHLLVFDHVLGAGRSHRPDWREALRRRRPVPRAVRGLRLSRRGDRAHRARDRRPRAASFWSLPRCQPVNVAAPLLVVAYEAVARNPARRSLSVVRGPRAEMLVREQELFGWYALVCGVELHGLSGPWPIVEDCVDR